MHNDGSMGYPDAWGIHLMTDDVERAAKATAPENGGSVEMGPMDVAENGRSAMIKDPGGSIVGAWEPNQQKGFELTGEAGAPAWFELHTGQYDKAVSFYREVFGWDTHAMSDTPEFRYTTLGEGEGQLAGIMDDKEEPSGWNVYFEVADVDAALERVEELGGRDHHAGGGHALRPAREGGRSHRYGLPARREQQLTCAPVRCPASPGAGPRAREGLGEPEPS